MDSGRAGEVSKDHPPFPGVGQTTRLAPHRSRPHAPRAGRHRTTARHRRQRSAMGEVLSHVLHAGRFAGKEDRAAGRQIEPAARVDGFRESGRRGQM